MLPSADLLHILKFFYFILPFFYIGVTPHSFLLHLYNNTPQLRRGRGAGRESNPAGQRRLTPELRRSRTLRSTSQNCLKLLVWNERKFGDFLDY